MTCIKYSSSALCSQNLNWSSKHSNFQEMLKFIICKKIFLYYYLREIVIFGPLLHLSFFQFKFTDSSQICKFCFKWCRPLLGVGEQHMDNHHVVLTFHYSYPVLGSKNDTKRNVVEGTAFLLHNVCISTSFLTQDRDGMTAHIKFLLKHPFQPIPDTSQMVNFSLLI